MYPEPLYFATLPGFKDTAHHLLRSNIKIDGRGDGKSSRRGSGLTIVRTNVVAQHYMSLYYHNTWALLRCCSMRMQMPMST